MSKKKTFNCSKCKSADVTATATGTRFIKSLPVGTKKTSFCVQMHRVRCHDCSSYLMEKLSFISSSKSRITKVLERHIIELRAHMCIQSLANYFKLNWHTVKAVEKTYLSKKYSKISLKHISSIGIDEIHMGKRIGDKGYLTIVRDLKSGATLFVGKGKKGECLDGFMKKLKSSKANIEFVAVDLAPSFTAWIKANLPHAIIVYDHFHVIKLMNDRLNKVRRRISRELEDEDKGEIKGLRWKFNRNNEDLEETAQAEIKQCCTLFSELGITYALKEALRRIYRIKDLVFVENALQYWCEKAKLSKIPELTSMAETLRKHAKGIIAFWKTGITSASMEGFNNKIGWLTRQAYGYRDEEYLILKIFDLPNLKIAKQL